MIFFKAVSQASPNRALNIKEVVKIDNLCDGIFFYVLLKIREKCYNVLCSVKAVILKASNEYNYLHKLKLFYYTFINSFNIRTI